MMRSALILILVLISPYVFSQKLQIRDAATHKGIADALVLSQTGSAISDLNGEVSLEQFNQGDSLIIQHPSYYIMKLLLTSTEQEYKVDLIEKSIKLDEVVVSVSRWAESSAEFPNKVVGITTKDISFSNPQTTADALMQTGEIYVQKSQQGGGSPMIRGFAANRILLTIDGIRLNNAIYRSGNLQNIISIDAHSLERTEVIFGPGSVQYGSDALGGVVNMMTFNTRLSQKDPIVNGGALVRYSSASNERTGHFNMSYSGASFASSTSISFSQYGDLKMGSNGPDEYLRKEYVTSVDGIDVVVANEDPQKQLFNGFAMFSFIQKLKFKLTDNLTSEAAFYYSNTGNIPRYDRLTQYKDGNLRYANWYYGPQEWLMAKAELLYSKKNKLFDIAKFQFAYQDVRESRHDRDFNSSIRRNRYEKVDVFTLNFDFTRPISKQHHLYYGLNAGFNGVSSTAHESNLDTGGKNPSASRYPDGSSYNNYAVYLNYEYKQSERLNVQAGIRYSQFILNATFDNTYYPFPFEDVTMNPGAPSGSLGLVYSASEETVLQVNISTAFRAPNIDDVGKVFDSEPGNVIVPNPDLKPEYAYNFDIGLTQNFGDEIRVDLTGFYTYLDNAIIRQDFTFNGQDSIIYDGEPSNVQALTNTGSAYLFGFNGKLFIDFTQNWSLTSTLNYTIGEDDMGNPLRHVSPAFGATNLIYKISSLKLSLFAEYSDSFKNYELSPEEQSKPHIYAIDNDGLPYSPSWFTLGFKSSYQMTSFAQLNFGVENILDSRYRTYSSGIVAPGRNWIIGIRASF